MEYFYYYRYLDFDNEKFFTSVFLPKKEGKFPIIVCRSPYVQNTENLNEQDIIDNDVSTHAPWLERGYAVVFQHCRGQGKSTGAFIPYIHEREDGLFLLQWLRQTTFYNGELFLLGGSYTASLHYTTAPFDKDIKGALFEVQDSERYRLWYRNGQMRKGHAKWHFNLYKKKCGLNKTFNDNSFLELPLLGLSKRVLDDYAEDFEQMLSSELETSDFWKTRHGGVETKNVTDNANIPILFATGYNDFYVGGMFKMWNSMSESTKCQCALLVSPYDHSDGFNTEDGLFFSQGKRSEQFGKRWQIDWFDHIRNNTPLLYKKGVITYYRAFENSWDSDFSKKLTKQLALLLGDNSVSFCYDPLNPPYFQCEGKFQKTFDERKDIISLLTKPLDNDVFVKGQMKAKLTVASTALDTSFYISISIRKSEGDYVLRHDITSLCYQLGYYVQNTQVELTFCFDEYAFLLKKGEQLRIDISSTDANTYVRHTNKKGRYYLQTETTKAINMVHLNKSQLLLPIER